MILGFSVTNTLSHVPSIQRKPFSLSLVTVAASSFLVTQLSIPTQAQLRHRLKFIKNRLKNSYMFRSSTIFRELQCPR